MLIYFVLIRIISNMHTSLVPALAKLIVENPENLKMYNSYLLISLSFGSVLFSMQWSKYIDKFCAKTIIIITTIMFSLSQFLLSISPNIIVACIGRFSLKPLN